MNIKKKKKNSFFLEFMLLEQNVVRDIYKHENLDFTKFYIVGLFFVVVEI